MDKGKLSDNRRCAVILTANREEFQAVRAHLSDLVEVPHAKGTIYEKGSFVDALDRVWDVAIVEVGVGNVGAGIETERAISFFEPYVVLFVGIAGGIRDVELCDIVAADRIYGYESGKSAMTFSPRPNVGESTYFMVQSARAEARNEGWLRRIRPKLNRAPHARVAPIAAGEKVIYSKRSSIRKFLIEQYDDAIAVEMEGRGFLQAAHANQGLKYLVICGISDLLSQKTSTDKAGFRILAAATASAFAFEVLANLEGRETGKSRPVIAITRLQSSPGSTFESDYQIDAKELDLQGYEEVQRDPQVVATARPMPLRLIQQVATQGLPAEPAPLHDATWGVIVTGALQSPYVGRGVTVAVLGSGIMADHEAFRGVELIQKDFTGEGNGDQNGHGTHVAGTIFGQPVQGVGVRYAVAPGVHRALVGKVIGTKHSATTAELVEAVQWAVSLGAHIIVMSVTIDFPGFVRFMVDEGWPPDLATSRVLAQYYENVRLFERLVELLRISSKYRPGA